MFSNSSQTPVRTSKQERLECVVTFPSWMEGKVCPLESAAASGSLQEIQDFPGWLEADVSLTLFFVPDDLAEEERTFPIIARGSGGVLPSGGCSTTGPRMAGRSATSAPNDKGHQAYTSGSS